MAFRMNLRIHLPNRDPFEVVSTLADQLNYDETAGNQGWDRAQFHPDGTATGNTTQMIAYRGWHAARRVGRFTGKWEEFRDSVEDVEPIESETDPTPPAAGAG